MMSKSSMGRRGRDIVGSGRARERRRRVYLKNEYALSPAPCAHSHCHAYSPVCSIVLPMVRPFSSPSPPHPSPPPPQLPFPSVLTTVAPSHLQMSALASSSRAGSFQNGNPAPISLFPCQASVIRSPHFLCPI